MALVFGLKPLIFASGSMAPALPTGSLALAVPVAAAEVSPGEVVSVVASDGTRITHRVVSTDPAAGLVLKGDANAVADLLPYTGVTVDRVLFSLPGLGYVVSWLAAPWIVVLGALLCAYLIYAAFFRPGPGATRKPRAGSGDGAGKSGPRRRTWLGIGAMAAVIAVAVPLGAAAKVEPTQAAWAANAAAGSNMAAMQTKKPSGLKCASPTSGMGRATKVDVTWAEPARGPLQLTGYVVRAYVQAPDGGPPTASEISSDIVPSSVRQLTLDQMADNGLLGNLLAGLLGALLGINYNLKITFEVSALYEHGWVSEPIAFTTINATSKGILGILLPTKKLSCQLQ
ncbi:hypothetical protein [Arthrobacter sp. PAMC 25486]|uniref:hypothetical protein n=1 Tax=Arthrobacter sp. PAMC 25486 TaxID=1494608 RepID=UPI001C1E79B2|nr:hypothetical protein [Arthrobacter sp. PAMC 25486]